jgi:hypothetical protein
MCDERLTNFGRCKNETIVVWLDNYIMSYVYFLSYRDFQTIKKNYDGTPFIGTDDKITVE